ncbi:hypothetical protein ND853_15155 [Leptospira levettii]|nr:hypothetical protein [Leptospira levettii]
MMAITKDSKISIKFEHELYAKIESYAANNEMDKSKVIRLAVKKFLNVTPVEKKRSAKN